MYSMILEGARWMALSQNTAFTALVPVHAPFYFIKFDMETQL